MPRKITTRKTANASTARTPRSKPFGQSAAKAGESRREDIRPESDRDVSRDPGSLDEETLSSDAPYNKTYGVRNESEPSRVPSKKSGSGAR
ncbi:MAG TPA: hypothetical protein VGN12_25605 [Pirellulales bacterium]|jgi:hypothetical protein